MRRPCRRTAATAQSGTPRFGDENPRSFYHCMTQLWIMRRARTLIVLLLCALLGAGCVGPPSVPQIFTGSGMSSAEPMPFLTGARTLHFEWENSDTIGIFVHSADTDLEVSVVEDGAPPSGSKTVQVSEPGEYALHVVCDGSWTVRIS